jgi:hypothetical protein
MNLQLKEVVIGLSVRVIAVPRVAEACSEQRLVHKLEQQIERVHFPFFFPGKPPSSDA